MGLNIAGFANIHQVQGFVPVGKCFGSGRLIHHYVAKGVEVHPHNGVALDKVGTQQGILHIHRKVATKGQQGYVGLPVFAYQFHIHCEGCVAGIVYLFVGNFKHESHRVATIVAIGQHAAVQGCHTSQPAKTKLPPAAHVHGMGIGHAFFVQPLVYFPIAYHQCPAAVGYLFAVCHVVLVGMAQAYKVGAYFIHMDVLGQLVASDKWVEQYLVAASIQQKTGMAVVSEFHFLMAKLCDFFVAESLRAWHEQGRDLVDI